MFAQFIQNLKLEIEKGLPGVEAQSRMAPASRLMQPFVRADFPDARVGAVLILLYPHADAVTMALIQRPAYDGVHGGQVSFPGGQIEESDPDEWSAATREAEEEIGVPAHLIQPIGALSPVYIPPSNFFVHPFMGWLNARPAFRIDTHEVENIIEMSAAVLLDDHAKSIMRIDRPGAQFDAPCYVFNNARIWGATAIMLSEVEMILSRGKLIS